MANPIRGKIIHCLGENSGTSKSGKAWRKAEYVLETEGQYPKKVKFSIMNERIDQANLQVGCTAEIEIDAESREWQGKWYTDLTAWKINNLGFYQQAPQPQQQPVYQQQTPQGYAPSVNPTNGYGQPAAMPFPTTGDVAF